MVSQQSPISISAPLQTIKLPFLSTNTTTDDNNMISRQPLPTPSKQNRQKRRDMPTLAVACQEVSMNLQDHSSISPDRVVPELDDASVSSDDQNFNALAPSPIEEPWHWDAWLLSRNIVPETPDIPEHCRVKGPVPLHANDSNLSLCKRNFASANLSNLAISTSVMTPAPELLQYATVISVARHSPTPYSVDPSCKPQRKVQESIKVVPRDTEEWRSYTVESIVDKRSTYHDRRKESEYLVKYEGYGNEFNEWMPIRQLSNYLDLIREYEKTLSQQPHAVRTSSARPAATYSIFPSPNPTPYHKPHKSWPSRARPPAPTSRPRAKTAPSHPQHYDPYRPSPPSNLSNCTTLTHTSPCSSSGLSSPLYMVDRSVPPSPGFMHLATVESEKSAFDTDDEDDDDKGRVFGNFGRKLMWRVASDDGDKRKVVIAPEKKGKGRSISEKLKGVFFSKRV